MVTALVRRLRSRIAVKLTVTLVALVALTMLVGALYLGSGLESFAFDLLEGRLVTAGRLLEPEAARLLARDAPAADVHAFALVAARPTGARITLIGLDGRVRGDSDVAPADLPRLESHANRPEVAAALAGRIGYDTRRSATVDARLLYVALPVADGGRPAGVLRLALPLAAVQSSYRAVDRSLLVAGLVGMVFALGVGIFVAGRVTRPVVEMQSIAARMSEGDFGVRAPVWSPDEIGTLGRALNVMAARLRDRIEDLEQEQGKVSAILDSMVEGVIAVDGRDRIVLMNERARMLFGLPRRASPQPFLEVVRNADLHHVFTKARAGAESDVLHREVTFPGPPLRVLQVNAVPLRLEAEVGVVMVLHDVTELRRLERVRTEFVANLSHELRTPLTAIQGYLETLLGDEARAEAREFLGIAHRHTERLSRLVADLTDLSNIELGRVAVHMEPVPVGEIVDSVLAIVRPRAEQARLALTADVPGDVPPIRGDRDRLAQILLNLVDNAVKNTPEGGRVTVEARRVDGDRVELIVRDTGIGIDPRDLPRVTERFYRVDRARSREQGGTGLGLAIVKHLVILHGGDLAIDSAPGRGTTVRVTLPAA